MAHREWILILAEAELQRLFEKQYVYFILCWWNRTNKSWHIISQTNCYTVSSYKDECEPAPVWPRCRSSSCRRVRATCCAMISCLRLMRMHFSHEQSRYKQNGLCPFKIFTIPWLRHLTHLGGSLDTLRDTLPLADVTRSKLVFSIDKLLQTNVLNNFSDNVLKHKD